MMDPLSVSASIIALLQLSGCVLSSCYRFVGSVNNAASDVDRIIRQVGHLTAILDDLNNVVGEDGGSSLPRLSVLAGHQSPLATCVECLEELKVKLSGAAGPMSFRRRLRWPFESKKVDEIMDKIQKQFPVLELALLSDDVTTSREIKASLEDSKHREERDKVLNWLCCVDPTVKHLASRRLHQPGSNHWIIESDSFKQWKEMPGQALWLHGIPGAGKTIICSTIIDHVEEICKSQPDRQVAYYYFDFSDQSIQKLGHFLRCLIWQLSRHEEYIPSHLWSLYVSCDDGRKEPDDEALASTLFATLTGNQKSYVIIDALDECPLEGRDLFYELVINRIGEQPGNYNFLFTSRKELDIEQSMTELGQKIELHNIPILTGDVNADIRLHVRRFTASNRILRDWSQQLRAEIEDTIANGAQGM
jgi:ankyrin repeat domain-containing protein 50